VDDYAAVAGARQMIAAVKPAEIPVSVERYAAHVGAKIRVEHDLDPREAGRTIPINGTFHICVNGNDSLERQRFTICHEIGHIALKLPSSHTGMPAWSYKRPVEEMLCDRFAAHLLLPEHLFQPAAEAATIGFADIDVLAAHFLASVTVTASRFAEVVTTPCAFVFSEEGKIKHASRSQALREARAWIPPNTSMPTMSVSARARNGLPADRTEIDAEAWLLNWERGGVFLEEARHLHQWDQTLTLLWFEDEEIPPLRLESSSGRVRREDDEEDLGIQELDGQLRWPGKRRRR
jgi:IrrE N-terminal-like domain